MAKKETIPNPIIDLAEKLVGLRKKPLLVFDADPVFPPVVLMTEHELLGKDYPEIDVLIHTHGGHIESAFNVTKLLRTAAKKINVLIPYKAKSAGTLICLGADNIIMSPISELGPLDTQIRESQDGDAETYKSALNGFKALEQVQKHAFDNLDLAAKMLVSRSGLKMAEAVKLAIDFSGKTSSCLYNQLNPITIGEYARALEVGELYGINILTRYLGWSEEKAVNTVKRLVYEYPSHGFSVDAEELQSLGFTVTTPSLEEAAILSMLRFVLLQEDTEGSKITIKLIEPPKPSKPKTRAKKIKNVTRKK